MYYRWHPLFGLSLPVHKRRKIRTGEQVSCQLPDGTQCSVPSWMLRPECAQFSFGPPLISVEALHELRHLLTAWQISATCDKALLGSPTKEEGDETISEATQAADESAASQYAGRPQFPTTNKKELEFTLMEFLINAAIENKDVARANGERDEPL